MNNSRKLFESKFDLLALLLIFGVPMLGLWIYCGLTNFRSNMILSITIFLNLFFWSSTYLAGRLTKYGTRSRIFSDFLISIFTGYGIFWMLGFSIIEKPLQLLILMICAVFALLASELMINIESKELLIINRIKNIPFWLFAVVFVAGFGLMGIFWFSRW